MNGTLLLAGRWLMAALFLVAGIRKIMMFSGQVGYFAKLGFPMPEVMTVLAIVIEVGGAILLIVGWKTRIAAFLLAGYTLLTAVLFHNNFADPGETINFLKNLGIAGGFLLLVALGAGRLSVDGRVSG